MVDTTAADPNALETNPPDAAGHKPYTVTATVNNTSVRLPERELTGREIKLAAIEQGVGIETDFQLSLRHGERYRVVGDEDSVRIHQGSEFLAVAPDDNA